MTYATLPELPYAYNALEPHFDAQTMEIHHTKHHQTYVAKLNEAIEKHTELKDGNLSDHLKNLDTVPEDIRSAVRNHGGGHLNHSMFWELLSPTPTTPSPEFQTALETEFGSLENFKQQFSDVSASRFGSGWAWLSMDATGKLIIHSTANQDNPLMEGLTPIIGLDVWEHAYYLHYQNRRPDFISAFWNVLNWEQASKNYTECKK